MSGTAVPALWPALWLCGPVGVGKSTIGWEIYSQVTGAGVKAAYVDLAQVSFCRPASAADPDGHRLKARNLGLMWPVLREAGARCLVVSGSVDDRATVRRYREAVPDGALTVCLLRAAPERLLERISARGRGAGPLLPGDGLRGQDPSALRRLADEAARHADELGRAGVGDVHVDTDQGSIEDIARRVRAVVGGWPDLVRR